MLNKQEKNMKNAADITITENEKLILQNIKNYDTAEAQRGDNYSNLSVDKYSAECLNMDMQALRGIVGSLVKKDLVFVDDPGVGTMFAYFTELGMEVAYRD
jgi:hypothetical protein